VTLGEMVGKGEKGYYEALGLGSAASLLGLHPEDMYCFSRSGRGVFAMTRGRPGPDKADAGSLLVKSSE
jgi:hypothetical protein